MCRRSVHLKHAVAKPKCVGKLLRNENETTILSYLTPQQGAKKQNAIDA